ncbi:hypothetical protein [Paludibaculum fermentans]|uniref:Pilus assembly protein n=1 Tax=Paludibaculum fermentans TaxID=1473598 RepID=A0A7S7NK07_PALFE|nr:hypothetical protein [Paludibaculum fermentans]QOY85053.1 hypothetical protein IRI77_19585 [Paludibaculum fermentans]
MRLARQSKKKTQGGHSLVDFALVSMFLIPIMMATISVGFNTSRAIQVTTVTRDAANMYARWVDFSLASNQNLLVRLAAGLDMTATSGNGVIILSKVTYIASSDCTGAGLTTGQCTNMNQYVIINRIVVGNASFKTSAFGTPGSLAANGDVQGYLTDASARATNFGNVLTLTSGQFAFMAEGFFKGLSWSVPGSNVGNLISRRYIF